MQLVRLCGVTNSSEVSWSDLSFLVSFFFFLIGRICVKASFFHICPFHCPVVSHVTCLNQWRRDLRCYVCLHCLLLPYALPTLPALSFLFFLYVRWRCGFSIVNGRSDVAPVKGYLEDFVHFSYWLLQHWLTSLFTSYRSFASRSKLCFFFRGKKTCTVSFLTRCSQINCIEYY